MYVTSACLLDFKFVLYDITTVTINFTRGYVRPGFDLLIKYNIFLPLYVPDLTH